MTLGSFRIFFFLMIQRPSTSTLFPYTTLFRSNALLVLERALVVMIGQAPAGLDAEKRSAVGPQCHVWYACKIHRHPPATRSEEHTSELQSPMYLVCRLLLEKKKRSARPQKIRS